MVLAVMVCFLMFRVYQVVSPPDDNANSNRLPNPPRRDLPPDVETPGRPPQPPPPPPAQDWSRLWRFDLFQYKQPRDVGGGSTDDSDGPDVDITLLRIREVPGQGYKAQMKTASRTGWYSEGDPFEAYELVTIDPDSNCVVIFAEQLERSITVCVGDQ